MFNPKPEVQTIHLANGRSCFVIDDVLKDPEFWLNIAADQQGDFSLAGSGKFPAYPGLELRMSSEINAAVSAYFLQHMRSRLGARRLIDAISRFSMMSLRPDQLKPAHTLCHQDLGGPPEMMKAASVLYLFKDVTLGGTSFYRPQKSPTETQKLVHDSLHLPSEVFFEKYEIQKTYMLGSNTYFEQIGSVEAKWNRIVFYDGNTYHSADILNAGKLNADPRMGRLTINGFFSCTNKAA
jgi:hypothetical protein